MKKIIKLDKYKKKKWSGYEFNWGVGIKNEKTNQWTNIILKPDGLEIDLTDRPAILHENGIEFLN